MITPDDPVIATDYWCHHHTNNAGSVRIRYSTHQNIITMIGSEEREREANLGARIWSGMHSPPYPSVYYPVQ